MDNTEFSVFVVLAVCASIVWLIGTEVILGGFLVVSAAILHLAGHVDRDRKIKDQQIDAVFRTMELIEKRKKDESSNNA